MYVNTLAESVYVPILRSDLGCSAWTPARLSTDNPRSYQQPGSDIGDVDPLWSTFNQIRVRFCSFLRGRSRNSPLSFWSSNRGLQLKRAKETGQRSELKLPRDVKTPRVMVPIRCLKPRLVRERWNRIHPRGYHDLGGRVGPIWLKLRFL